MQEVKVNDRYYIILDYLMLRNYGVEALDKLFHLCKNRGGLLFIFKRLCDLEVVQKFLEN